MTVHILTGDCRDLLATLPDCSVRCVVTSPPYWGLRDYGTTGQIGLESTPAEYVEKMVAVFRDVRRVLANDGTLWLNIGDCYATGAGSVGAAPGGGEQGARAVLVGPMTQPNRMPIEGLKPKDLVMMPARLALALQADGWWIRSDIIWAKPNPMPESVTDRPTKSHEYLFLMSKSERYYYDGDAIREPQVTDFNGDGRHPIPPMQGAQPKKQKTPDGWDTTKGNGSHGPFHKNGREKGHFSGGVSAPDYDERKWKDRSDGLSRPPMTMKDREYDPRGRNKRSVWTVPTAPFKEAHFATFPPALIEPCILAGTARGDTVLDPFGGAGTTGLVADRLGRNAILLELNPEYAKMAERRITGDSPLFAEVSR